VILWRVDTGRESLKITQNPTATARKSNSDCSGL